MPGGTVAASLGELRAYGDLARRLET